MMLLHHFVVHLALFLFFDLASLLLCDLSIEVALNRLLPFLLIVHQLLCFFVVQQLVQLR